jgi:hypothetical protein
MSGKPIDIEHWSRIASRNQRLSPSSSGADDGIASGDQPRADLHTGPTTDAAAQPLSAAIDHDTRPT